MSIHIWIRNEAFFDFSLTTSNQLHEKIKKKTYFFSSSSSFLLHLHRFVYKTKTANAAIKSDILDFLVQTAVHRVIFRLSENRPY